LFLTVSHPLNAIDFVFCTDSVKPHSVTSRCNLCAAFSKSSSVSAIVTWSSASNSFDKCWFFDSLIPFISCFCHLIIISSKYILNSVCVSYSFINFYSFWSFVVKFYHCFILAVSIHYSYHQYVCICLDFKMWNKICLYVIECFLAVYEQQMCF
jgi:hypothetical protein